MTSNKRNEPKEMVCCMQAVKENVSEDVHSGSRGALAVSLFDDLKHLVRVQIKGPTKSCNWKNTHTLWPRPGSQDRTCGSRADNSHHPATVSPQRQTNRQSRAHIYPPCGVTCEAEALLRQV